MPWKVSAMSDCRLALCHAVRVAKLPVTYAARQFGVSRKTAHKWLKVADALPEPATAASLVDRSRRPASSPARTSPDLECSILQVRDLYHWGPRKIRAFLLQQAQREQGASTSPALRLSEPPTR